MTVDPFSPPPDAPHGSTSPEFAAAASLPPVDEQDRLWALFFHLSQFVFLFVGIPVVVPLVLWLIKKDDSPYLDDQGKEATNFSISIIVWMVIMIVGGVVLGTITCGIGFLLGPLLALVPWVVGIVGTIMGIVASNRGQYFRYPMCFRFIP